MTKLGWALVVMVALAGLAGCGDDDGSGPDVHVDVDVDAGFADGGGVPEGCRAMRFQLRGQIEGRDVVVSAPLSARSEVQGEPSFLEVVFEEEGMLRLEWEGQLASGARAAVSGTLAVPGEDFLCVAGELVLKGDGFDQFELTRLERAAAGGVCPGTSITGSLAGCSDGD